MARTKGTARRAMGSNRNVIPEPGIGRGLVGESGGTDIMGSMGSFLPYVGALAPLAAMFSQSSYLLDSAKFFVIGAVLEGLRRVCMWVIARFRFQLTVTAHLFEGDQAHDWIINLLTEENVWKRSCEFQVSAKSSARKWGLTQTRQFNTAGHADYVPTWSVPQIFRWKGYYVEVMKSTSTAAANGGVPPPQGGSSGTMITLTMWTFNMSALSDLIEEARIRYIEAHKPHVIIHVSEGSHGPNYGWGNTKQKPRRPVGSVVLPDGKMDMLLKDAREFLDMEHWYSDLGIPHRRGYLLYGPPGTGKSSTIYSLAGELGLEIYSLSLSTGSIDDIQLQHAVNGTPKRSILLIEDIDCAFPSREDEDEDMDEPSPYDPYNRQNTRNGREVRSLVTMSGLLNVLDGVGSDDGKIFFATTNYVDRLDPALMRPGRIDKRVEYSLATKSQAQTLFLRFFTPERFPDIRSESVAVSSDPEKQHIRDPDLEAAKFYLIELARGFAEEIPDGEFSTAELQGYLLGNKMNPVGARNSAKQWVEEERTYRKAKEEREAKRKEKAMEARARQREKLGMGGGMGMGMGSGAWGSPPQNFPRNNARAMAKENTEETPENEPTTTTTEKKEQKDTAENKDAGKQDSAESEDVSKTKASDSKSSESTEGTKSESQTVTRSSSPGTDSTATSSAVLVTPPPTDTEHD